MAKRLFIDYKKCHGCRACEVYCASREDGSPPDLATRIWTVVWDLEGWGVPVVCQQCVDPLCLAVCPQEAIFRDEELDRVMIDYDRCIGCRMCLSACPFGAIGFDGLTKRVVKCDLCAGEPVCVELCSYGAIQYIEIDERVPEFADKIREIVMGGLFKKGKAAGEAERPKGALFVGD